MILPHEPKEGLYICINNDSDCLNTLENSNRRIAIGTPLLFMGKSDLDEYLFQDAAGYHLKMSAYSIKCRLKNIPNRMPNRLENLLRWFYGFDEYADDSKNPSHVAFTLLGAMLSFMPQSTLAILVVTLICDEILPVSFLLLAVIPWIPNFCFWIAKRTQKFRGEFLLVLKSPYRKQLLAELESLLEYDETKKRNND